MEGFCEIQGVIGEINALHQGVQHHVNHEQQDGAVFQDDADGKVLTLLTAVVPFEGGQQKNQQHVEHAEGGEDVERGGGAGGGNLPHQVHGHGVPQSPHHADGAIIMMGQLGILHAHGHIQGGFGTAANVVEGIKDQNIKEGLVQQNQGIQNGGDQDEQLKQPVFAAGAVCHHAEKGLGEHGGSGGDAGDETNHGLAETNFVQVDAEVAARCIHHKESKVEQQKRVIGTPGKGCGLHEDFLLYGQKTIAIIINLKGNPCKAENEKIAQNITKVTTVMQGNSRRITGGS